MWNDPDITNLIAREVAFTALEEVGTQMRALCILSYVFLSLFFVREDQKAIILCHELNEMRAGNPDILIATGHKGEV